MHDDWKRQMNRLHAALLRNDDPAAWVTEADAVEASQRYPYLALRGPVFGLAALDPQTGPHWRLVKPMTHAMPQYARNELNSLLWFQARDHTDDPGVRRALLAAVAVLERERVDELDVRGVRYRVVRGDEFARSDEQKDLEPPRATDVDPGTLSWNITDQIPSPDIGFTLDPDRTDGLMAGAMKLGLRDFSYSGPLFSADARKDSERAVTACPDIVLLPAGFGIAERTEKGWQPRGGLLSTPHEARRLLYRWMTETFALLYEFNEDDKAAYARAAEEFKATHRAYDVRVDDSHFRICRLGRLVRFGPDGPELPRPSDQDAEAPMKMHPTMNEDGTLDYDDE